MFDRGEVFEDKLPAVEFTPSHWFTFSLPAEVFAFIEVIEDIVKVLDFIHVESLQLLDGDDFDVRVALEVEAFCEAFGAEFVFAEAAEGNDFGV